jgi:hypothetical protein
MINKLQKYTGTAMALSTLILLVLHLQKCHRDDKIESTNATKTKIIYIDKDSNRHTQISDKYILRSDIKELIGELNIPKLKEKQIERYIETRSVIVDTIYFKKEKDTIINKNSIFILDKIDTINTRLKYKIFDTIKVVCFWKRSWALGKKKYFVDIQNSNKNNNIYVDKNIIPLKMKK